MARVGIDIVDITRIDKAIKRSGKIFLGRVFTEKEISNAVNFPSSSEYFSKIFSFKESFVKAKGCGFNSLLKPTDVEVVLSPYLTSFFKKKEIKGINKVDFFKIKQNIVCRIIMDN